MCEAWCSLVSRVLADLLDLFNAYFWHTWPWGSLTNYWPIWELANLSGLQWPLAHMSRASGKVDLPSAPVDFGLCSTSHIYPRMMVIRLIPVLWKVAFLNDPHTGL